MWSYLWQHKLTCSKNCIQERDWLKVSLICSIHHIKGLKLAGSKCDALHSWRRHQHQWRWRWWDGGELPPANPILIFCTRPRLPVFCPPLLQEAQNAKTFHWGIMSMALLDDTKMENLFRIISGDGLLFVKAHALSTWPQKCLCYVVRLWNLSLGPTSPKTSSWKYSFKSVLVVVISSLRLSRQGKGGMPADV